MNQFDRDTQIIIDTLKKVAAETLDRKRRLGHYAVIWQDGKAIAIGEDAPVQRSDVNPSQSEI